MAVSKGIEIEFRGDATPLKKAINSIRNEAKTLDKELGYINKSLKFNPTSVTLWSQKQKVLNQEVEDTKSRLRELKDIEAKLKAENIDRNSAEFRELEREIVKTKNQLGQFRKDLIATGNARLTALSQGFKQLGAQMTAAGQTLTTRVTAPLTLLGGAAAKSFAEVDKIMVLTNSTMANTSEEADLLNSAMKEAAANSTYGMEDAANAALNFARAGLDASQAASALAPAMNLAAGEGGELDTVSAGLVATINGFHGSFDEAAHYADVFANACNNSALDVNSLSEAMSVAAPIFSAAGYSVEDAALYMGVMANNGIEADKAANSLKTGLARLVSPAKDGATAMENLGISVTNADGTMKDTITIQKELHEAFATLSESEQIAAASAIFGKNQMAPWLALINSAPGDVSKLSSALQEQGTASGMASEMMSGFGGSIEKLKSSIDVAAVSLGEALAPMISKVVGWVQKGVEWFNSLDERTRTIIATVGVAVAALGPVLLILGSLFSAIGSIIGVISSVAGALALIPNPISIVIAAIGALIAIGVALYKNWDTIKEYAGIVKDWVVQKFTALKDGVANAFNSLKTTAANVWNAIRFAITNPIDTAVAFVRSAVEKIKGFFSGLKLELPHIKLPHFSIQGSFSLAPPSIPTISVDWYKNGGIFTKPTIFPNGVGVGDAIGGEAVLPLKKLWDEMDKRLAGGPTINVYASEGMDVRELADEIERRIIAAQNRRRQAWA